MKPQDYYDFHAWFAENFQQLEHRFSTMYQVLALAMARNVKTIVETGTSRAADGWRGDGRSTNVFAAFARRYGCRLWTCDIDPAAIEASRDLVGDDGDCVEFVVGDSVTFLRDFPHPIDLLYLDSLDFSEQNVDVSQGHALAEGRAAMHALDIHSIVLIDDCNLPHGGKGGQVVPYFLGQGWRVVGLAYQILMTHSFS
jgi:SAM-dependent methyltransferase